MSQRVQVTLTLTKRTKILLDGHASLYQGTPLGTASAIAEDCLSRNLTELRFQHYAKGGGPEPEPEPGPPPRDG